MENTMNTIDCTNEELHRQLWDAIDNIDYDIRWLRKEAKQTGNYIINKTVIRLKNERKALLKSYLLSKGV